MKIGVLGPGALGCLFAAKLARAGEQATLLDYRPERAELLAKSGIKVEENGEVWHANPAVSCGFGGEFDLLIVLCKAHATAGLVLPKSTAVLTLQNGLNNAETLAEKVGAEHLLAGTTAVAVTRLADGHIRYVAPGLTRIGAWCGCPHEAILQALRNAGFETEHTPNPAAAIWQKAIINAGINPLTALLNVPNGKLLEQQDAKALLHALVEEAAAVATAEGHPPEGKPCELAEAVCAATAENISSMLQDIRNGRMTEIDALSGEILRRADRHGIPAPNTRMIWRLLRGLERR